jgi:hypothetical protein
MKMMYRSALLAGESSGDFTIVLTFSLLGLSLSLLAIGTAFFSIPNIWPICSCYFKA